MSAIARRLDATEGQVWSLGIGLVIAVVLALAGLPPVVHHAREPLASSVTRAAPGRSSHALTPVTQPAVAVPVTGDVTVSTPSRPTRTNTRSDAVTAPAAPAPVVAFGTITSFATVDAPLGGVAVARGRVYVSTDDGQASYVYGFNADGRRVTDIAISGQPQSHTRGITALATEASGTLIAADAASARVLRIDPAKDSATTVVTLVDLPSCVLAPGAPACEPGLEDHAPLPSGIAAASDGTILVADSAQDTVWRVRPGAKAEVWSQSVQQASGDGPTAIAIAGDGSVLETVGTDLSPANPTAAAVYRIPVGSDGAAGDPQLVAKLARGDQPAGMTASPDGRIFVALRATSVIVVLGADGKEQARLEGNDLDAPAGLALGSVGELFGATGRAGGPGRVLRISV